MTPRLASRTRPVCTRSRPLVTETLETERLSAWWLSDWYTTTRRLGQRLRVCARTLSAISSLGTPSTSPAPLVPRCSCRRIRSQPSSCLPQERVLLRSARSCVARSVKTTRTTSSLASCGCSLVSRPLTPSSTRRSWKRCSLASRTTFAWIIASRVSRRTRTATRCTSKPAWLTMLRRLLSFSRRSRRTSTCAVSRVWSPELMTL
mmetsp:Transcript_9683/g.20430  ORF Transcript_9683/g.20430 Transcript_9683/m.20430 type:complete len:205 (+) Transcript_9683:448-1062(+)